MKTITTLAVFVGIATFAVADGQLLESFEAETSSAVSASGCAATRIQEHATDGEWALQVVFAGRVDDTWPGLNLNLGRTNFTRQDILVADVFNLGPEPAPLSCRIDSSDGRSTFTGQTLPPGVSTKYELWFGAIADVVDIGNIKAVYPYVSRPRSDYTLVFDAFRIETTTTRFKRLAYREIAPLPSPSEAENQLGCLVFQRTPLAHVFANSVPWPGERPVKLRAFASQGETETLTLSLRTLQPIQSAALKVTPFMSPSATLPETAVEPGCVRFLDKKTTYSGKDYVVGVPTYVEPGSVFENLPAETTRTFWLRLRIPKDTPADIYRAEAVLRTKNGDKEHECRFPLVIRVLPLELPPVTTHFIGEYYRLTGKMSPEETRAAIDRDLADMRDHGMTSVGLCFGIDETKVTLNGTEVTGLGFDGTTPFEHLIEAYLRNGFTMPIILLADSGQHVAQKAGAYPSPEYDAAYKSFWTAVQKTCYERNWPEIIVQPVDEPSWQGQPEKDLNVHLLKLLKEIPGLRTEQDGPPDAYFRDVAGPFADVWNYNGSLAAFPRDTNPPAQRVFTIYNNDVESYRPEVERYVSGFFQKAAAIDGVFNWEYRGGSGSLYDDLDGSSGDFVCVYPPSADSQGGPSVAWEVAREGADDLRYVNLLEQWIAKARSTPGAETAADSAAKMLEQLLTSIKAKPGVRGTEQWSIRWTREEAEALGSVPDSDAKGFVGGFLKLPNAWSFNDYARARWAIAAEMLTLMKSCGETPAASEVFTSKGTPTVTVLGCIPWIGAKQDSGGTAADTSSNLDIVAGDQLAFQDDIINLDLAWANRPAGTGQKLRIRILKEDNTVAETAVPVPDAFKWRLCLQTEALPAGNLAIETQILAEEGTPVSNTFTCTLSVVAGLPWPATS